MANYFEYHASSVLKFNLLDFEGPIELLYTLIVEDGKYDIETFPLSQITEQYMQYMEQVDELDIDVASDFVSIAATLLEIKSRDCLPQETCEDDTEDYGYEEDPEELLRLRLKMFGMFKDLAERLKAREKRNKFYRRPVFTNADAILVFKNFNFDRLIDVYGQMLLRFEDEKNELAAKKIQKDPYTVAEKITYITKTILQRRVMKFRDLMTGVTERSELISTFQALLELMKKQVVKAAQENTDGDIYIQVNEDFDESAVDMDELVKVDEE